MKTCKYCGLDCTHMNMGQFGNHRRWCDKNPKIEQHRKNNSESGKKVADKIHGEYKIYIHQCEMCGNDFEVKEREKLHPQRDKYFCSRKCANSVGGQKKSELYHGDDVAHYATVAWRHHIKKCVVCGEELIVAVHHLNCNHNDNRPENLIPLCPTHHQYMHSKHKVLIEEQVNKYIKDKWG